MGCGRALLEQHFAAMLPARHASDGNDLFTALCHAEAEDGAMFRDSDVVDHMIFLLMAGHDTVTITLSTMMYELARHPAWQERLREEAISFGPGSPGFDDLATFASLDLVMRESMRLVATVPALPRRTTRDTEVLGYFIPADALVSVNPSLTHRLDAYWSEPDRFDPERFSAERREDATHRWAYVPFGGGVHRCIGMHFAQIEAALVMHEVLRRFRWRVEPSYVMPLDTTALPKPADDLPIHLERFA